MSQLRDNNRYDTLFSQLAEKQQGALVPFVTLGDPGKQQSLEIVRALIAGGADALELGIPFSDPIADGPVIQAANIRALEAKITPDDCFEIISQIREEHADIPIGLLLYSNLIFAKGLDNFYQQAKQAGVDSILVADVPLHESAMFRAAAEKANIDAIFIATPNASLDTLKMAAEYGSGYTYLLSRAGVTGTETQAQMPADKMIQDLESLNAAPALLGFGISQPEHVRQALDSGAKGAITGSAVVKIIEEHLNDGRQMTLKLTQFIKEMKSATTSA